MQLTPFHIAIQVRDIDEAREFYGLKMGLAEGRSAENWIDFNMFGHQFVTHYNSNLGKSGKIAHIANPVDGHGVPVPHCGVVMQLEDWEVFSHKVREFVDDFIIEPYIRFKGEPGEQGTMILARTATAYRMLQTPFIFLPITPCKSSSTTRPTRSLRRSPPRN